VLGFCCEETTLFFVLVDLDLSDEEGNVKLLHQNLDRYANELLKERERLILLRVNSMFVSTGYYEIFH